VGVSLDLREQDPAAARFNAVAQAVMFTLLGGIVGLIAAGLLTGTDQPAGWVIVAACTGAGASPIARWAIQRRHEHVDLYGIHSAIRPLLERGARAVNTIEQAASSAPEGPVSDQLFENHATAVGHLHLMESDARRSGLGSRQGLLQLCHQLDELADASQRLANASLAALPTVLRGLTERTMLIERALTEDSLVDP